MRLMIMPKVTQPTSDSLWQEPLLCPVCLALPGWARSWAGSSLSQRLVSPEAGTGPGAEQAPLSTEGWKKGRDRGEGRRWRPRERGAWGRGRDKKVGREKGGTLFCFQCIYLSLQMELRSLC